MKTKFFIPVLMLIISLACSSVTISFDNPVAPATPNAPETLLPDLVISQVYVSTVGFNGQCLGSYFANASVSNLGQAPADNVVVLELATGHTIIVGRLEAGQKMDLQVPAGSPTGIYALQADPQNLVLESDENNNITSNVLATATPVMDCLNPTPTLPPEFLFTPTPAPFIMSLSFEALRNATYYSSDWGDFTLTNGIYYRPLPTGQESPDAYATRILSDVLFYGDMNFDGAEDVGVILVTKNGGTGSFFELALVLNQNGIPYNIATVSLGDRIVVQSGYVQDGVLGLVMLTHGPNDPMCCASQLTVMRFRLDDGQLVVVP
jgi:hypothetical protein